MDNHQNGQEDQLSSWKAVAEYLKCRPRTCIRWEKTLGLPIHRLEGSQKSRVFAYRRELDAWLQKKLQNGHAPEPELAKAKGGKNRYAWILAGASLIILSLIAAYFLASGSMDKAKAVMIPPPASDGTPRSSGLMDMYPGDIITTEFLPEGKLRVWRKKKEAAFFESWGMGPLRHTSLAIGDVDRDADQEIIAPGYCRDFIEQNGQTTSRIRFFLNAYKRGVGDWWKTTFYDKSQCVYEKDDFEFSDIALADLDGVPANEIVLGTAFGLSVYRYDLEGRVIKLVVQTDAFPGLPRLHLRGVAAADHDADGTSEIFVIGNEWAEGVDAVNKSWLMALVLRGGQLSVEAAVPLVGNVSPQSLRIGNVVPGRGLEAVFPLYRKSDRGWATYVAAWAGGDKPVFETFIGRSAEEPYRPIHIDVGNILPQAEDEVVVAKSDPNEIVIGSWNGGQLVLGPRYLLTAKAELANVFVSPAGDPGNPLGRIMACGSIKVPGQAGSFYVEVVDYRDGFVPVWLKAGGTETEIKVSYAAFGK